MKTIVLVFLFLSTVMIYSFTSRLNHTSTVIDVKIIEKSLAKINDTLYASKFEMYNGLYLIFEKSLQTSGKTDLLSITKVDTTNWTSNFPSNEPFVEFYYSSPAYKDFPLVNISYEAAVIFCQWLTDEYNAAPKKMFKKVLFRLPSPEEWEMAARAGHATDLYSWGNKLIVNNRNMCNYKKIGDEYIKYDSLTKKYVLDYPTASENKISPLNVDFITAPVLSYEANDYGLYNVCGNVAEMTNIKGLACGGGWKSAGGDVTLSSRSYFSGTSNETGFRFFMVVLEK